MPYCTYAPHYHHALARLRASGALGATEAERFARGHGGRARAVPRSSSSCRARRYRPPPALPSPVYTTLTRMCHKNFVVMVFVGGEGFRLTATQLLFLLRVDRFAGDFFAAGFFAGDFFAVGFLAGLFAFEAGFAGLFLAAGFLGDAAFFAGDLCGDR